MSADDVERFTPQVPAVVEAWVAQLCDPDTLALIEAAGEANVDIRLSASKGRVRRHPVVTVGAGPNQLVDA